MVSIAEERDHTVEMTGQRSGANARQAILVAGMHRSGTSAVTRVLSIIGCSLPGNLVPASRGDNDRGFWESRSIVDLNDEMLESAGSYWDDWNFIRDEWFASPVAGEFAARASEVVDNEFDGASLIVLKDPRICRFLPLWTKAVEASGYNPSVIMPLRNPLEVAQSLQKRSHVDLTVGHLMWLRHVLDAEFHSRGLPRSVVLYETLMKDWRAWISKLDGDLGINFPRLSPRVDLEIDEFLDPGLWRNRAPESLKLDNGNVPAWVRDVYLLLRRWGEGKQKKGDEAALNRIRAELQDVTPVFARPLYAYRNMGKAYRSLAKAEELLRKDIHQYTDVISTLQGERVASDKSHHEALEIAKAEAAAEKAVRSAAEMRYTELEKAMTALREKCSALEADKASLLEKYSGLEAGIAELQSEHEVSVGVIEASLEKALGQVASTKASLSSEGELRLGLEKRIATLQTEHAESEGVLKSSLEATLHQLAEKQAIVSASEERIEELQNRIAQLLGDMETLREQDLAKSTESEERIEELQNRIAQLLGDMETLREQDLAKSTESAKAQSHVANLKSQLETAERLRKSNDEARFRESAALTRLLAQRDNESASLKEMLLNLVKSFSSADPERRMSALLPPERRKRVHIDRYCQVLKSVGCVDSDWYLSLYPDVAASGLDPVEHFAAFGVFEGRIPHPMFDQSQ
jgi:hypothetical protein